MVLRSASMSSAVPPSTGWKTAVTTTVTNAPGVGSGRGGSGRGGRGGGRRGAPRGGGGGGGGGGGRDGAGGGGGWGRVGWGGRCRRSVGDAVEAARCTSEELSAFAVEHARRDGVERVEERAESGV